MGSNEYEKILKLVSDRILEYFPFKSQKDILEFKQSVEKFSKRISRINTETNFLFRLQKFVADLENSHTKLTVIKKLVRKKRTNINFKIIDRDIGYLKIKAWRFLEKDAKKMESIVRSFAARKLAGIIIDVCGNKGGRSKTADELAGHFFKKRTVFGRCRQRIAGSKLKYKTWNYIVEPRKPFLSQPAVILIDGKSMSSTELFVAGLKDNNRAILIGEKTAGGTGNPQKFAMSLGRKKSILSVATWIYCRKNGKLIEGRGIKPDYTVKGPAKALAKAVNILKKPKLRPRA